MAHVDVLIIKLGDKNTGAYDINHYFSFCVVDFPFFTARFM